MRSHALAGAAMLAFLAQLACFSKDGQDSAAALESLRRLVATKMAALASGLARVKSESAATKVKLEAELGRLKQELRDKG